MELEDDIRIQAVADPITKKLTPELQNVPVYHNGRKIGLAKIDQKGHIRIEVKEEFDKQGIFRMFALGEADHFNLGVKDEWTESPGQTSTDSQTTQSPTSEG